MLGSMMSKEKNYKEIANNAFKDKVNNIVFIMKFLNDRGGLELVREYFTDAVSSYIIKFEGFGGAKKWIIRQWIRASSKGYLNKILEQVLIPAILLRRIDHHGRRIKPPLLPLQTTPH